MDWLKEMFFNKYLRSIVRGITRFIAGFLVAKGIATPDMAEEVTDGLSALLLSPEFLEWLGIILFGSAQAASFLDKKKR